VFHGTDAADFLSGKLGIHSNFIKYGLVENIPLTVNGKVDYARIMEIVKQKQQ
jgi:hypothetical protein